MKHFKMFLLVLGILIGWTMLYSYLADISMTYMDKQTAFIFFTDALSIVFYEELVYRWIPLIISLLVIRCFRLPGMDLILCIVGIVTSILFGRLGIHIPAFHIIMGLIIWLYTQYTYTTSQQIVFACVGSYLIHIVYNSCMYLIYFLHYLQATGKRPLIPAVFLLREIL